MMTLGEFRVLTKDQPDDLVLFVVQGGPCGIRCEVAELEVLPTADTPHVGICDAIQSKE